MPVCLTIHACKIPSLIAQLETVWLESSNAYASWRSAEAFVDSNPCSGTNCSAAHVAMIGPSSTEASEHVQYFALENTTPLVSFRATASYLSLGVGGIPVADGGTNDPYFTRVCPTDGAMSAALYAAVDEFGWDQVAVVYEATEYGRLFLQSFSQRLEEASRPIKVTAEAAFQPFNDKSAQDALRSVRTTSARVIILIADDDAAAHLLLAAHDDSMTGVGWTWLGGEWVQQHTWLSPVAENPTDPAAQARSAKVFKAMVGAIGVVPETGALHKIDGGRFASISKADIEPHLRQGGASSAPAGPPGFLPPTTQDCPALNFAPFSTGVQPDEYMSFLFDSVWFIAQAAATASGGCSSTPGTGIGIGLCRRYMVTPGGLGEEMLLGTPLASPMTGSSIQLTTQRDRYNIGLRMVNVRSNGALARVGTWTVAHSDGAVVSSEQLHHGSWTNINRGSIVWPGGRRTVPTDRVVLPITTDALVFMMVILGVVISIAAGAALEARGIHWLPESGMTVLLGMLLGAIVLTVSDEAQELARFDATLFSLVFLPIIIFESGYALDKHPFFTQLGSILSFACVGTLLSTFTVGGIVYSLGQQDIVPAFSFSESMCFGALISAVDPVAILATFTSLRVDPRLNALVYGEAVINDAVAVVLFRTFAEFLVVDATSERIAEAFGRFFGIFIGSVVLGVAVGLVSTVLFRYQPLVKLLPSKEPNATSHGIVQAGLLLLMSYFAFAAAEAAHLSGIVSSLFAGISINHYTNKALSPHGRVTTQKVFRMLAFVAETVVFFQVGMNVILYSTVFSWALVAVTIVLCVLARALNIFPLAALLNLARKDKIPLKYQVAMWHAGLRGAIAYATSIAFPSQNRDLVISTTSMVILFTIFAQGGSITWLMGKLGVETGLPPSTHKAEVAISKAAQKGSCPKQTMANMDRMLRSGLYHPDVRARHKATRSGVVETDAEAASIASTGALLPADHSEAPSRVNSSGDVVVQVDAGEGDTVRLTDSAAAAAMEPLTAAEVGGDSSDGDEADEQQVGVEIEMTEQSPSSATD